MLESGVGIEPTFTGLQSVAITLMANHSKFGAPGGIRTPILALRRRLTYPLDHGCKLVLQEGFEPSLYWF